MEITEKEEEVAEAKDKKKTEGEKKTIEPLNIDTSKIVKEAKNAASTNVSPVKGNDDISKYLKKYKNIYIYISFFFFF